MNSKPHDLPPSTRLAERSSDFSVVADEWQSADAQARVLDDGNAPFFKLLDHSRQIGEKQGGLILRLSGSAAPEQDQRWRCFGTDCEQRSEIDIGCHDDPVLTGGAFKDRLIGLRLHAVIADLNRTMSGPTRCYGANRL